MASSLDRLKITGTTMPNVFISYVRDNSDIVDKLADELRKHGVTVWLDREQIMPGMRWQDAIRKAIREGDYFIACFSAEYVARQRTYMNTEIGLAIDMLQEMPADRVWFIPVLLSECEIPDRYIGGGETLKSLQWEPLYKDWEHGTSRILKAIGAERPDILTIDKPIHLELIRIPAGPFLMGDDKRTIEVPEFYIGKYPVTNAQYAAFAQTKYGGHSHWEDKRIPGGKEDHPVVWVSWYDALSFCEWLNKTTGRPFRLLTEEEWEKAARGTDGREWPWGDEPPTEYNERCNFGLIVGDTTPVGNYPKGASPYGVHDMAGNVAEWVQEINLRGGSFHLNKEYSRCSSRTNGQSYKDRDYGCRVGMSSGISTSLPSGTS